MRYRYTLEDGTDGGSKKRYQTENQHEEGSAWNVLKADETREHANWDGHWKSDADTHIFRVHHEDL